MSLGNISVAYIDILTKTMTTMGHDCSAILSQFSLNEIKLSSPDARISIPRFMRMGYQCIGLAQAPWLGLSMGKEMSLTHLGIAGLMALSAPDLHRACHSLTKFELLNSYNARGNSRFEKCDNKGLLSFYSINPYNDYNHFIVDLVLSGWCHCIETLTNRDDLIERVCFEFPAPMYKDHYAQYFNCEVLFSQPSNCVVLKPDALNQPCVMACPPTHHMLERSAQQELEIVQRGLTFEQQVSRALSPMLNKGTPSLEQLAHQLNMAPWTVRRRLNDDGVTFQHVLNNTRRGLAQSYVRDTKLTLGEISYLLGFASASAFQRAFKRWTGIAPGTYRGHSNIWIKTNL